MSRAVRRDSIERENPVLPIARQCRLLAVSRAAVYRKRAEVSAEDLAIMALLDRHYLARPYYGSRRMAAWLATALGRRRSVLYRAQIGSSGWAADLSPGPTQATRLRRFRTFRTSPWNAEVLPTAAVRFR